jgi:hypothetical protein
MRKGARALLAAGLWLAAPVARAAPGQPDLTGLANRFETLRIDSTSVPVSNLQASSGHLKVLLKSGHANVVRAGEEAVGIFFHGSGSFEYRSEDPIEFPLTSFNTRNATDLSVEKGERALTIRDTFTDILWLSSGGPLPELAASSAGPSLASFFELHQEKFRHVRSIPPSHLLTLEKINSPSTPLRVVDFEGGKEDLRYVFDAWESRSESLVALRKSRSTDPQVKKNLYGSVLSEQPIGRDRRDPLRPRFFLTDARLEVLASDGKDVSVSVTETLVPQQEKQSVFRFDLYNTTYDVIGAGALQPRTFRVREVSDGAGRPLAFHHENGDLLVALAQPAEPDRPIKLHFQIEGDFLIRPGGDNFWLLGI